MTQNPPQDAEKFIFSDDHFAEGGSYYTQQRSKTYTLEVKEKKKLPKVLKVWTEKNALNLSEWKLEKTNTVAENRLKQALNTLSTNLEA